MMIEEGSTYLDVNGSKVGPMKGGSFKWVDGKGQSGDAEWGNDGKVWCAGPEGYGDLIAEWTEGPVRTVTRREVVEGVYGVLRIKQFDNACFLLSFDGETWVRMDRAGSSAAAAVLLELAGALE